MAEDNNLNGNFFFMDPVCENVTSFSLGHIWLYFYKDVHIGTRDMIKSKGIYLKLDKRIPEEGYNYRHEVTNEIIVASLEEEYGKDNIEWVTQEELLNKTFGWVADIIGDNIDKQLVGK